MIQHRSRILALAACLACAGPAAAWQTTTSSAAAEELIAQEEMRLAVEEALELYHAPTDSGDIKNDNFVNAVDQLVAAGPGVVPFLVNELDQALPETYFFCAYALGKLGTAEAAEALRGAIEKAERERGSWAETRKAWAGYGVGLSGDAEAIDLLLDGKHLVGHVPMHRGVSVLEAVALQTAPACVPRLLDQLEKLRDTPERLRERDFVLKALRRVGDPSGVKQIEQLYAEAESQRTRRRAAQALASIGTPEALESALRTWDDEDPMIRRIVCLQLEQVSAPVDAERIRDRLEAETDPSARGALYRMLADREGAAAVVTLEAHWGRPDPEDRRGLVRALGLTRAKQAVPLLHRALLDPDNRVSTAAAISLGQLGTKRATDLLIAALGSQRSSLVTTAVEQLVAHDERRAAGAIAARLIERELSGVVSDAGLRHQIDLMARAVVSLRATQRLDDLRAAAERQNDPLIVQSLTRAIESLAALREYGEDRKRWIAAASSDRQDLRRLAFERLSELGGEEAAKGLAALFGRVGPEEGIEILDALHRMDEEPAQALLERVLLGPEFDTVERAGLREVAAWSARRLGGARMLDALERSVLRRDGRDAKVTIYLGLLGGERAVPTLDRVRLARMRYLKWSRGKELDALDRLKRRILSGTSVAEFELPPHRLRF